MVDYGKVKNLVKDMGDFADEDIKKYAPYIRYNTFVVNDMLLDKSNCEDERIINLAAAKSYENIIGIMESKDGCSSFTAGDVSYSSSGIGKESVKRLVEIAKEDCKGLIRDGSFAFIGV